MSSKSKRQSHAAAAALSQSQLQTPQAGSSHARVASPVSPTRKSRIQEKNELAGLNNRFAAVIDRNQFLESENSVLLKKIEKYEEHTEKVIKKKVDTYEKELHETRRIVDETAKERTRLDLLTQQLQTDLHDAKDKLTKKNGEVTTLQNQMSQLDAKYNEATNKNNSLESKVNALTKEVKELKDENNKAKREVENLRQRLEQESIARVSAEQQLKARNEDLQMKNRLLEEEIHEVKSRKHQEIQEVDGRLQQEYNTKLEESLKELRDDYEARMQALKDDMESLEYQKNADNAANVERYKASLQTSNKELTLQTIKNDELQRQLRDLEQEKIALVNKISKLETDSSDDRNKFSRILAEKDADIERISGEKATLIQEYQDLMDTKVQLRNEINTYDKLLETVERRQRASFKSPAVDPTLREMTPTARSTPLRGKRKLGGLFEQESEESAFEFISDSLSHGDIEITNDDPEGLFIRLRNKSDKDIPINGFQLIRLSGDLDTTHKFGRGAKILANDTLTVWSADATGATHNPPHDYIMKEQKWSVSDHYKTVLVDTTSKEQAVRETKKEQVRHQKRRFGYDDAEELFHQDGGERAGTEKCIIM